MESPSALKKAGGVLTDFMGKQVVSHVQILLNQCKNYENRIDCLQKQLVELSPPVSNLTDTGVEGLPSQ